MEHLSAGLLSMDEKGTKDKIQEIFSHLSQEAVTKEQFKQVFSAFLYTLMQKNTALIPIIAGYKLSDNDLAAQIKKPAPHQSVKTENGTDPAALYGTAEKTAGKERRICGKKGTGIHEKALF